MKRGRDSQRKKKGKKGEEGVREAEKEELRDGEALIIIISQMTVK